MTPFARRHPQAFGVLVTFAGVMVFVPDALVMRLIGGDMMALAVFRGLMSGTIFLVALRLFAPSAIPGKGEWFDRKGLLVIAACATGMITFCAAMGNTSAANALLILSVAPFLAALLSWLVLSERIDRPTAMAIVVVFAGVLIVASGSLGHGRLLGDAFALINAATIAAYYVTLRTTGSRNMLAHVALGNILGGLIALPFADFVPLDSTGILLVLISGALIQPLAAALLMLGPRYLPAAEVSMITLLEVVLGPLLVWLVLAENPGTRSLVGGAVILTAIALHSLRRLSQTESPA